MPQMAPLYWEILFIMFLLSMMIMSTLIFHYPKYLLVQANVTSTTTKNINWKW
uniref:ATP synthase complex subunit 8 n=1 Tax=Tetrarthria variegata TaxID=2080413 RepID=A0A2P1CLU9_9HEMI|nr:ATP synthase F0 subunit 8 [Tetrarthria variegata]